MFANRSLTATHALLTIGALAIALSFAGCKSSAPAAPTDDASLTAALQTRLTSDDALKSEPINSSVQDKVATLNGTVSSEAARSLAAADAAQVAGIKTVVNNLSVQTPPPIVAAATPPAPPRKATPAHRRCAPPTTAAG